MVHDDGDVVVVVVDESDGDSDDDDDVGFGVMADVLALLRLCCCFFAQSLEK